MSYGANGNAHAGTNTAQGQPKGGMSGVSPAGAAWMRHLLPETKAWMNQLTNVPSKHYLQSLDNMIRQLMAEGIWQQLDRMWLFATEYQDNARVSIVNPSWYNKGDIDSAWTTNITEVNTPGWTALQGYKGNGTSSYLNTNYNPANTAKNYVSGNASLGLYVTIGDQSAGVAEVDMGSAYGSYVDELWTDLNNVSSLGDVVQADPASGGIIRSSTASPQTGLFVGAMLSTAGTIYVNGSSFATASLTVQSDTNSNNILIGAFNNGESTPYNQPVAEYFTKRQYAMAFIGANKFSQSVFYNIFQEFAKKIGFNIFN